MDSIDKLGAVMVLCMATMLTCGMAFKAQAQDGVEVGPVLILEQEACDCCAPCPVCPAAAPLLSAEHQKALDDARDLLDAAKPTD